MQLLEAGTDDPKFEEVTSNTSQRAELAASRIPDYASKLLEKLQQGGVLTETNVRLMYGEYRAYHRSRKPFRSSIERISIQAGVPFDASLTPKDLLQLLRMPEYLSCYEAAGALQVLYLEVQSSTFHRKYAVV